MVVECLTQKVMSDCQCSFGDDDTIFFMHGVRRLLADYDPELPYFLTDSMYEGSDSPKPGTGVG